MSMQSQDIIQRSATSTLTPPPQVRNDKSEVAKLIDVTTCIGCKGCQAACSEWNDIRDEVGHNLGVYDNPMDLSAKSWTVMRFSEVESADRLEWLIRKDGCMHCSDPSCLKACPTGAIHFGTKEEMKQVAEQRITQLKKRGYQNAGLYDPQGVGGTHVMYVLHHADQPSLHHNLPDNPQISTPINLWKGILKPLATLGFVATFAGLIFHYVGIGPNTEETEHDTEGEDHHE